MNNKGMTLIELLIVVVVLGIIAAFSVTAVSQVLTNTRKNGFIVNTEIILGAARDANNSGDPLFDDGVATLRELIDNNYIESLGNDPWGGTYDLDNSIITVEQVTVVKNNIEGTFILSTTPLYVSASETYYIYKSKIVTTIATLGFEGPLEDFTKEDIIFLDGSNASIFEQIIESFNNDFEEDVVTEDGDDTINVGADIQGDASVQTGGGDDTINVGSDIEGSGTVDTGEGNDTINVEGKIEQQAVIDTGVGDDTINVEDNIEDNATVNTGDGDDVINVEGEIKNKAELNTGDGNDTLNIDDDIQDNTIVTTGNGHDTVIIGDDLQSNASLDTGEGDDTVSIGDDLDGASLNTGSGNDSVTVGDKVNNADLNTGSGNDILNLDTLRSSTKIDTGDDNDTVSIRDVSSGFKGSVNLGSGSDTLTIIDTESSAYLNGTSGTFNGGIGNDTLNLPYVTEYIWNRYASALFTGFETVNLSDTTIHP